MIDDGTYAIYPEGGAAVLVRIRQGRFYNTTEAANFATHKAAGDAWAPAVEAVEAGRAEAVDGRTAAAVVAAWNAWAGDDIPAELCTVERVSD